MMKILHLPGESVRGYSGKDVRDIISYFDPDLTITSNMIDFQRKKVKDDITCEFIDLDILDGLFEKTVGNEDLIVLTKEQCLSDIDLNGDKKTIVMTDLIEEDMDPITFDYQLTNTSIIDDLEEKCIDLRLFSTSIEAGKKPTCKGQTIYGLGTSENMGDVKVPCVLTGDMPHIETLDVSKVGISAVPGLGRKFSTLLERRGISSRDDLCACEPSDLLSCDGIGAYRSTKWISSAKAMEDQKVYRIQKDDLRAKHRIFIDIETDSLNPSIIWHIGIFDDDRGVYEYFLEKEPARRGRIIRRFVDHIEEIGGKDTVLLAWYGEKFDFYHLENFIDEHSPEKKSAWDDTDKIDFMKWVDDHAALPCRSSKLENVAMRIGYEPDLLGLDGGEVGKMYSEYMEDSKKELDWEKLKLYGKEDVMEMKYIYDRIEEAPMVYDLGDIKKVYRR